jgi:hypothetical protein
MRERYQIMIEGTGFSIPVANDDPIIGFITERRVLAADAAKALVVENLRQEPKVQWLFKTTAQNVGSSDSCTFSTRHVRRISWWKWHFGGYMRGFAFYSDFA